MIFDVKRSEEYIMMVHRNMSKYGYEIVFSTLASLRTMGFEKAASSSSEFFQHDLH